MTFEEYRINNTGPRTDPCGTPVEDEDRFRLDTIESEVLGPMSQVGPEESKNSAFEAEGELKPVE